MNKWLCIWLCIVVLPAPVRAGKITAGEKVRVTQRGGSRTTGIFQSADDESIVIDNGHKEQIERYTITRVERYFGSKRNTANGLMIGAGVGLLTGAVLASAGNGDPHALQGFDGVIVVGYTLIGLVSGAVIGFLVQTDDWGDASLNWFEVGGNPSRGETTLTLRLRF